MKVNGNVMELKGRTIMDLLAQMGLRQDCTAVSVNGDIVQRALHGEFTLNEDDVVEVVSFVGGG